MIRVRWGALVVSMAWAAPVVAQSTYVAAGVGMDVFRPSRFDVGGIGDQTATGEAIAVSARVGAAITDRWGVEFELTSPAEIKREVRRQFPLPLVVWSAVPGVSASIPPPFESTVRMTQRNTTLDTVAWVAQTITSRVDLVYLGGVAFTRAVGEQEFRALPGRGSTTSLVFPRPSRTITYSAGPLVGFEGRLRLTEHVVLIPGIRLHGIGDGAGGGWLVPPSVALGWRF